jgi:hypothetical protein
VIFQALPDSSLASSVMLCLIAAEKLTGVSEVLTAPIIIVTY